MQNRRAICLGILTLLPTMAAMSEPAWSQTANAPIDITVTDTACVPNTLNVPSGIITFRIKNSSHQLMEWEILKGEMVYDERENINPAGTEALRTNLQPGEYQMTCGLVTNPKGVLVAAAAKAAVTTTSEPNLSAVIATYKAYVTDEVGILVSRTQTLVNAVKSGNLAEAQAAYAPAHLHYERIEPIAELFNDLDTSMDSRADDFEKKAEDPAFTGFHRIEKALFADHTTNGMGPVADKLMADALDLQRRLGALVIPAKAMVGGAADLIEEVASKKISGEEDRYSHTDLWDFQANLDGAQKILALLRPQAQKTDPALVQAIDSNMARVDAVLATYKTPDGGFESFDKLSPQDRNILRGLITALAEDFSKLPGTLGVS